MDPSSAKARSVRRIRGLFLAIAAGSLAFCGCTSFSEYVHNGFKVGPNYVSPPTMVSAGWLDAQHPLVRSGHPNIATWWCVFDDPQLNKLIETAYDQNLTVRAAGYRILQAREERAIALGNLFPQQQSMRKSYDHTMTSANTIGSGGKHHYVDTWAHTLEMSWELDFWGKFRRAVESADAALDASMADYDDVVVILLGDVALNYAQARTLQKRLDLAHKNVAEQEPIVKIMETRLKANVKDSIPDYNQLKSNLEETKALIPQLEIQLRRVNNALCTLLGTPPRDLMAELGDGRVQDPTDKTKTFVKIPKPLHDEVVVGIPADTLLQRPDVRRAERLAAAQSAQIGVAQADMYPHIAINGTLGLEASALGKLYDTRSWMGNIGPSLQWNILNYGRILANVRFQDARYQEFVANYQQTLLNANEEAENWLTAYLKSIERAQNLQDSATAAAKVTNYLIVQKKEGFGPDTSAFISRLFTAQNFKVAQEDIAAQAEGDVALALIQLYRALGGGWQIKNGATCENPEGCGRSVVPCNFTQGRNSEAAAEASRTESTGAERVRIGAPTSESRVLEIAPAGDAPARPSTIRPALGAPLGSLPEPQPSANAPRMLPPHLTGN